MENNVLILGKNYSTILGAIRGIGEAGYKAAVYFITGSPAQGVIVKNSKYVCKYTEHTGRDSKKIVEEILKEYAHDDCKYLIITTDDYTAWLIDQNRELFSKYFLIPHFSGERSIAEMMDKTVQAELASSFGFKTAQSWVVLYENGSYTIPDGIVYPCFFKPLVSVEGGKGGMKKCESAKELTAELGKVKNSSRKFTVLVQEYLNIDKEYSISAVCFGSQVLIPAILRKLKVCQSHKGTTVCGVIENADQLGEYRHNLEKLLSSIGLYSIVDIELFQCDGEVYFNEINFRTSAVCYGAVAGGANILGLFAEAVFSGKFETPEVDMCFGKTFLCEKAAWDDYITEFITKRDLKELYNSSDYHIIRNDKDPKPEKYFLKCVSRTKRIRFLKLRIKKLLGRA